MRSSRRILWYAVGFITIIVNVSTLCCHAIEVFTRNARDTQSRLVAYLERTTQRLGLHNGNYLSYGSNIRDMEVFTLQSLCFVEKLRNIIRYGNHLILGISTTRLNQLKKQNFLINHYQ